MDRLACQPSDRSLYERAARKLRAASARVESCRQRVDGVGELAGARCASVVRDDFLSAVRGAVPAGALRCTDTGTHAPATPACWGAGGAGRATHAGTSATHQ